MQGFLVLTNELFLLICSSAFFAKALLLIRSLDQDIMPICCVRDSGHFTMMLIMNLL
jgi:hypothetical protein